MIHDCVQGSPEWFAARMGIPTASNFNKILTAGGEPSKSQQGYMDELLADWLAGVHIEDKPSSFWMDRGNEIEDQSRNAYSFVHGVEVRQVGFITRDDGMSGCSPDGLIEDDGMLELKNPKSSTMVKYYRKGVEVPTQYIPQVQGQLWVAEREWCDFRAGHPLLTPLYLRVYRDEPYINLLAEAVEKFVDKMLTQRAALEAAGWRI